MATRNLRSGGSAARHTGAVREIKTTQQSNATERICLITSLLNVVAVDADELRNIRFHR